LYFRLFTSQKLEFFYYIFVFDKFFLYVVYYFKVSKTFWLNKLISKIKHKELEFVIINILKNRERKQ
jgi:hypothetical protein